jgi:hypothetical protein
MKPASSRSAKPPNAKQKSTSKPSKTDHDHLKAKAPVIADDHPEADIRHVIRGVVRRGLQPRQPKTATSPRIEQDVPAQ